MTLVSNDGKIGIISKRLDLLVNHKSENSKHGSTAVVQLNGTLLKLGLFIKVIPAEVNVSVTEVTNVLVSSSRNITHEGNLQPSNEGDDLALSLEGDGIRSDQGGNSVGEGVEGISGVVDVSGEVDSGTGHNLAKEGKLSDTSVLDLNITETVETFLGNVSGEQAEGIEESKRRLDTELILEGVQGGGGGLVLGRGESGGRADKGSDDGRLHDGCCYDFMRA
ncbi:putative chlorophyll a/b binding protein [Skeletonema marinoi]|uniref:Chlorophyll a/b binding protein n=2 Tax=Skeletonema marinoi TaxID=267567 RepID=A0AAD8XV30_9STRA|nr:putative chlorophyll a/b binding protein [Skeletonema marinoi]